MLAGVTSQHPMGTDGRGPVEKIEDVSVSPPSLAPALTLAPDKKKLVWNIG